MNNVVWFYTGAALESAGSCGRLCTATYGSWCHPAQD
jgi:hypothetical protein